MSRRHGGARGVAVLAVLAVGVVAALLILPKPLRDAYLGLFSGSEPAGQPTRGPVIHGTVASRETAGGKPSRPRVTTVSPTAAIAPGREVPRPDSSGHIRIPMTDKRPRRLPAEGVPAGWQLEEFTGRAVIELVRSEAGLGLRLRSSRTSFVLYRDVIVDLAEHPMLAWSWKVSRLPVRGDVRHRATDDQAAQVYVVFPRWPSPLTQSDVVGYIWDTRTPTGTQLVSPAAGNVRVIVVRSGRSALDRWTTEERNVASDYTALFGRQPPRVGLIALMIDTEDTRGEAEAAFADLRFSRKDSASTKTPTSMLR